MNSVNQYVPHILIILLCIALSCTNESAETDSAAFELAAGVSETNDDLIILAESAAPAEISGDATILDVEENVLREGTNGWTCIAMPGEPMCLDEKWMKWTDRYLNREEEVNVDAVGIGYMLHGDQGRSNIHPYAEEPTADNDWVTTGPHLLLVVPDPSLLEGFPTDPLAGGPYIMWADTPFEHLMIPIDPESVEMPYRDE